MSATLHHTRPRTFTLADIADELRALDITYRQIDYWIRTDRITLDGDRYGGRGLGSGHSRQWSIDDVNRLRVIAALPRMAGAQGSPGLGLIRVVWEAFTKHPPAEWGHLVYVHHERIGSYDRWRVCDEFDDDFGSAIVFAMPPLTNGDDL